MTSPPPMTPPPLMTSPPLTLPQRAAVARVACGIEDAGGLALLSGPSGVGKTLVLHALAADERLADRCGGVRDVAGWLAGAGDLPRLVLADDAHLATEDDLMRLLARCRAGQTAAVVLAGQGRLLTLVGRERRLEQAVRIRSTLLPGSLADTEQLLAAGRERAGWPSFDESSAATIHEIAAGIPADIVRLADLAGVVAAARALGRLTPADIEAVHRRLTPHAA
jgi:type II secretory pathway predicted ATPase ExeA